jgi:hypothetical protein
MWSESESKPKKLNSETSTPLSRTLKERKEKKKPSLAYRRLKKNKLFMNCGTHSKTHTLWVWGGGGDFFLFSFVPNMFLSSSIGSQCVPQGCS